ncbi:MAG: hypothetical protein LJE96_09780, partial [Deltaproteobacteria bacterium]|nr:hypothetical protein [Deltaproteobacteria bacterium]
MSDAYENDEPHGRNTGAKKDIWTKLSAIGGVSTAVMVALIGSIGSCVLKDQQVQSNRVQLYTELMSKREDSENALRKDMFKQILISFLTEEAGGECTLTRIDKMLLNLELISRNFHETLDIRPLFFHVLQKIV